MNKKISTHLKDMPASRPSIPLQKQTLPSMSLGTGGMTGSELPALSQVEGSRHSPKGEEGGNKFIQVICLTALMAGSTMQAMDKPRHTTLHIAARDGEYELVAQLLANGAAIDAKSDLGWTPLICAARRGHEAVCKLLLANGAAVDAKNVAGHTPLIFAASNGHEAVCRLLIEHNAAVDANDNHGWTPLIWAALDDHESVCSLLMEHNAAVDGQDHEGWTPLMCAARYGQQATCRLLLANGAAVNAKNNSGSTPLILAASHGHEAVCQFLINAMLQTIQESKAKIVALLGIKKFRQSACLNIINRDATQLIARPMYEPAALQLRNLFDQINAIPANNLADLDFKQELLEYVRQQLRFETNIAQEANHE